MVCIYLLYKTLVLSGATLSCELVYFIQTLDCDTAKKIQLELRVPVLETKDERYPYYKSKINTIVYSSKIAKMSKCVKAMISILNVETIRKPYKYGGSA